MDQDDSTKNGSTPGQFSGQVDTKAIRTTDSYKKKNRALGCSTLGNALTSKYTGYLMVPFKIHVQ